MLVPIWSHQFATLKLSLHVVGTWYATNLAAYNVAWPLLVWHVNGTLEVSISVRNIADGTEFSNYTVLCTDEILFVSAVQLWMDPKIFRTLNTDGCGNFDGPMDGFFKKSTCPST